MKILTYVIISWVMSLLSHEVMFPISYTIYLADIVFIFILFSTAISIKKFIAKAREYTSLLLVIIILLMVLYYMYLITIFLKKELLLESSIEITLITILVILVYNLVKRLMIIEKKNYQMELYNQELSSNRKNYDTLENSIYEIKKIKHDINHIFLTLLNFLMNKDYDKIHDTLASQLEIVNNVEKIINTGNQSLDLIFTSYIKAFEKNHIEFITNHFDGEIKIDKIDFYTLLGNLIDNAIENCSSTTNKKILCDIYEENNMLFITCKNTCLNNPLLDNPKFNTTKLNTSNHGIGLKSVEMIVNKNNGMINYDYSINYFMVKIAILNSNNQ
ncbi:MAG: GHKL domain-containing protein [Erysipelotrichaceae bacterium]